MTIPRKIHYIWLGGRNYSKLQKKCIASWHTHMPNTEWEYMLWNEETLPKEVLGHPYVVKMLERGKWSYVSDFIRFWVLEREGGIYLDTDMEALRPLDEFLDNIAFVGTSGENRQIESAIIGTAPNSNFIAQALQSYTAETEASIEEIGPSVLAKAVINSNENIAVYPPEYFFPFPFGDTFSKKVLTDNTYTIHWWDHSWGHPVVKIAKKMRIMRPLVILKKRLKIIWNRE